MLKAGAKRERELPRVDESSNSRSRLALNSHALSATLAVSHPLLSNLNRSNFCWESPRVFSHLARVCLVTRWTLVNSRSRLAGRTIVNESWRKLSFNSRRLNSRQLSISFGPALSLFTLRDVILTSRLYDDMIGTGSWRQPLKENRKFPKTV